MLDLSQFSSFQGQNLTGKLAQEIYEEFLVCKICYEAFKSPKCLSCLHTFCEECIERHISGEVTYNKQTDYHDFTCPLCRKRTQLPLGGVKKLPDNFLISGLNELVNKTQISPSISGDCLSDNQNMITISPEDETNDGFISDQEHQNYEGSDFLTTLPMRQKAINSRPTSGLCEICSQVPGGDRGRSSTPTRDSKRNTTRARSAHLQTSPSAHAKCLDCNKLLCKECVNRHRTMHVTKAHAIFELASEVQIACTTHHDEMVRFYCQKCNICVCVLCTFHVHRDHEVINFTEALTKFHEEVTGKIETINQGKTMTRKRLESLEEASERIKAMGELINQTSENFKRQIEEDAQDMIRDLHKKIGRVTMDAIERRALLERDIELADALHEETEKLLDSGHEIIVLMKRNSIMEKFSNLNLVKNSNLGNGGSMTGCPYDIDKMVYFHPGSIDFGCISEEKEAPIKNQSSHPTVEMFHDPEKVVNQMVVKSLNNVSCQTETNEKKMRSRGLNTDTVETAERETNTHPRGITTQINFTENAEQCEDSYMQLADGRIVSKINGADVKFDEMDNLTRARLRRKFKEKGQSTVDDNAATNYSNSVTSPTSISNSTSNIRRTSLYSTIGNTHNARRYRFS